VLLWVCEDGFCNANGNQTGAESQDGQQKRARMN